MIATVTDEHLRLVFYDTLIARLEDQARWREAKAEEWPEDHRNKNSAEALWTAAQIVRQFDPGELPAVRSFVEFAQVLERNDLSAEPWSLVGGWFVAGRFHFDNHRRDVTYVEVVDCLTDMFRQSAKGLRRRARHSHHAGVAGLLRGPGRAAAGRRRDVAPRPG